MGAPHRVEFACQIIGLFGLMFRLLPMEFIALALELRLAVSKIGLARFERSGRFGERLALRLQLLFGLLNLLLAGS